MSTFSVLFYRKSLRDFSQMIVLRRIMFWIQTKDISKQKRHLALVFLPITKCLTLQILCYFPLYHMHPIRFSILLDQTQIFPTISFVKVWMVCYQIYRRNFFCFIVSNYKIKKFSTYSITPIPAMIFHLLNINTTAIVEKILLMFNFIMTKLS